VRGHLCHRSPNTIGICSDQFDPPLDQRVDVEEYSKKLLNKSVTFEAWRGGTLVGLLAAYFDDPENRPGFITNVSVTSEESGRGVASELMNMCIQFAKIRKVREIEIEVSQNSQAAVHLYRKFGFTDARHTQESLFLKLVNP
jgi:ribosomal protein S18 acetylase RimI-like enzyme